MISARIKRFIFCGVTLLYVNSYAEFPVTRFPGVLEDNIRGIHNTLLANVREGRAPNCFVCCFSFKLENNQRIDVYLRREHAEEIPEDEDYPIDLVPIIETMIPNIIVFKSHGVDENVYDKLRNLHTLFLTAVSAGRVETATTKNQAMLLSALDERSVNRNGDVRSDVWSAMRSTDSKAGAIYVLQHKYVIPNIINELCEVMHTLPVPLQIISIEFHGCTTRDMCALCFTNMNIIQYLCNNVSPYNTMEFSFLRYLRHILTHPITPDFHGVCENATIGRQYAIRDCSAKMFISSTRVDNDNLNFQAPVRAVGEGEDFLYQFRVVSPEARAIVGEIEADRARGVPRM